MFPSRWIVTVPLGVGSYFSPIYRLAKLTLISSYTISVSHISLSLSHNLSPTISLPLNIHYCSRWHHQSQTLSLDLSTLKLFCLYTIIIDRMQLGKEKMRDYLRSDTPITGMDERWMITLGRALFSTGSLQKIKVRNVDKNLSLKVCL